MDWSSGGSVLCSVKVNLKDSDSVAVQMELDSEGNTTLSGGVAGGGLIDALEIVGLFQKIVVAYSQTPLS